MRTDSKNLSKKNLSKNRLRITERIHNYFMQHPNSKPKRACEDLGIDYNKYKNMASTIKGSVRKYYGLGRPHKPHRHVLTTEIDADSLALVKAVCVNYRVKGRWYRASNRNRMMCFIADQASVKVWESGTVHVEPHVAMSQKDLADFFFVTLSAAAGIRFEPANMLADSLVTAGRHKCFPVGEAVPPFKIDHYKESLGIEIYADGSHPYDVEVKESWPPWIKPLILVNRDLALNLQAHIGVMKGIGVSTGNLADVVKRFHALLKNAQKATPPPRNECEPLGVGERASVILEGQKKDGFEEHPSALCVILEGEKAEAW